MRPLRARGVTLTRGRLYPCAYPCAHPCATTPTPCKWGGDRSQSEKGKSTFQKSRPVLACLIIIASALPVLSRFAALLTRRFIERYFRGGAHG